jgi:hypothetical protein
VSLALPFGLALTIFRNLVHRQIMATLPSSQDCKPREIAVFTSSALRSVESVVIPPTFRLYDVSCGFPTRIEILMRFSGFQERPVTMKHAKAPKRTAVNAASEWAVSLYDEDFADDVGSPMSTDLEWIKLALFMYVEHSHFAEDYQLIHALVLILGSDPIWATFLVSLTQMIFLVFPTMACRLLDDAIAIYKTHLIDGQFFAFRQAITRFIAVLSVLPMRYLEQTSRSAS